MDENTEAELLRARLRARQQAVPTIPSTYRLREITTATEGNHDFVKSIWQKYVFFIKPYSLSLLTAK
jgi:hypothetical protein